MTVKLRARTWIELNQRKNETFHHEDTKHTKGSVGGAQRALRFLVQVKNSLAHPIGDDEGEGHPTTTVRHYQRVTLLFFKTKSTGGLPRESWRRIEIRLSATCPQ